MIERKHRKGEVVSPGPGPGPGLRYDSATCAADLSLLAVDVSDAVGQRVGPQQGGGALRPVHRHQRVLAHQHLPDVLGTCHPDQRAAQQMGLEHVPVLLPPRCVETRTLETEAEGRA